MTKSSVLVLGGGAAGHQIAYQLRDAADVTLVDPKTYWEVPMAVPRLLVEPDALKARMRYDSFLGAARHVQGRVAALTDRTARIKLSNDSECTLSFDYAILATGSSYVDPLIKAQARTEEARANEILAMHNVLRRARSVVVAGGGPVGVETATELCETFPRLSVTLVHNASKLLEKAPGKFAGWAKRALEHRGVKVVLDDLVSTPKPGHQPTDQKVRTQGGRIILADAVIWAAGMKPVTDYVVASWPDLVKSNGRLKVDSFLRLEGHPNLFVAGDVADLPEGRLAIVSGLHAKSIVGNLKRLLASEKPAGVRLKPYAAALPGKGMGKLMIVSLGREDGLSSLPFGQFRASFIARKIKSRDMLVGMSRKAVGLTI